jgi:uncharacterized DUF497 family protein
MKISYDPAKRAATLTERGLDFEDAPIVFAGPIYTKTDSRFDYNETRYQTVGTLGDRMVLIVWTPREKNTRHIISMRKCNDREQKAYQERLGKS